MKTPKASDELVNLSFAEYLKLTSSRSFLNMYTSSRMWWNYTDDSVKRVISEIHNLILPNATFGEVVKTISNWIWERMKYTKTGLRKGAVRALIEKEGDCSEFSDIFITLARALKIPTRRIWGWVITGPFGDRLSYTGHAWVEIWSPIRQKWLPLDVLRKDHDIFLEMENFSSYIAFYIEDGIHDLNSTLVPLNESFLLGSEEWIPIGEDLWFFSTIVIRPLMPSLKQHSLQIASFMIISIMCASFTGLVLYYFTNLVKKRWHSK